MIYYLMKGQLVTVFLTVGQLTSITLPSKIVDYVGGVKSDFNVYELNRGKSLVFDPKSDSIDRNFIVFLKERKIHFHFRSSKEMTDRDISILWAKPCSGVSLLKETQSYQLFECPKSFLYRNKLSKAVKINGVQVKDREFISKGVPIIRNNKLLWREGEFL